jgi:hypothetical protein
MAYQTDDVDSRPRLELDQQRMLAGLEILRLTDQLGFDAYAAAWLHDRPSGLWRYLLVTPMLDTKGALWVHDRLLRAFIKRPLPAGITPLDIFVIEPETEDAVFGQEPSGAMDGGTRVPTIIATREIRIEGFSISDGFAAFYRRLPADERQRRDDPSDCFDLAVRRLEAA